VYGFIDKNPDPNVFLRVLRALRGENSFLILTGY